MSITSRVSVHSGLGSVNRSSFLEQQESMRRKWTDLAKNDPRRVVRALSLTAPRGETIDGDEAIELPCIFEHLKSLSQNSTSSIWKGLVAAGVIAALCKFTSNFGGTIAYAAVIPNNDGTFDLSRDVIQDAADLAPSPYFLPLSIICNAVLSCIKVPPTATEAKTVEELKKHWSTLMQKIWSDPAGSLGDVGERVRERAVVAQVFHRLSSMDPSFLEVILKPSDLTLAIVFRNWLYSTDEYDTEINASLLVRLLHENKPRPWKSYIEQHPLLDNHTLLSRILLGSSKGSEKKKRTPNQAAELIIASFARHFRASTPITIDDDIGLFDVIFKAANENNAQLFRALYKSEEFWGSLVQAMKKHGARNRNVSRPSARAVNEAQGLLLIYFSMRHKPGLQEHADVLVYNWIAGGFFDGIEAMLPSILQSPATVMCLGSVLTYIESEHETMSAKTRAKLRSELPRPRLQSALMKYANKGDDDPKQLLKNWKESKITFRDPSELHDPTHPIWTQVAWQAVMKLTYDLRPWRETCSRRGCDNSATEGGCGDCHVSAYCSAECLRRDTEHDLVCKWVPVLWIVDREQRQEKKARKLLTDGIESPEVMKQKLEEMRAAGEFTEVEAAEWTEAIGKMQESRNRLGEAEPTVSAITEVEGAMATASLSDPSPAQEADA